MKRDWKLAKSLFAHKQLSPEQIEEKTGIPADMVKRKIYKEGGWLEKFNRGEFDVAKFEEACPVILTHNKARSLEIITESLSNIDPSELDSRGIKDITDILTSLDKLDRLDKGKATSITGVELDRMDAKDVVAQRRRLSDYIDAEYSVSEDE